MKSNNQNTPQLRVAVTPHCNFRCAYCRPGGEGYYENIEEIMSFDEIVTIILLCSKVGFRSVKFTGGEPMLREDIIELITYTRRIPNIDDVQMVTNGSLLEGKALELKNAGLDMITISLDAIKPELFRHIRRDNISSVIKSIRDCQKVGLPVRINMVVMNSNLNQVKPMIELASKTGSSLKLLDLIYFPEIEQFWKSEYLHFDLLRDLLEKWNASFVGLEAAPGGIGAPLTEYRLNKTQIFLKDSTRGTFYHKSCETCNNYKCQDALISVRVTHDGHLKNCLIRNDNLVKILCMVKEKQINDAMQAIKGVFEIMTQSKYHPFAWKPDSYLNKKNL
jgi:cyclic pyranopterin phosphate synthase